MSKVAQQELLPTDAPSTAPEPAAPSLPAPVQGAAVVPINPMALIERAVERGDGIEIIEKLMDLQERYDATQARKAFDAAVSEAKAEITPIARDAEGHNSKRYATFASIAKAVDPILARHGLSYRFRTAQTDRISVTCVLAHRAGHSEESTLTGLPDKTGSKNDVQAIGSTLTYLQRYSLIQALGLAVATDDDGKAADTGPRLTEKQIDDIRDLLEAHEKKEAGLLQWLRVERLEDVPSDKFETICAAIKAPKAGK